jgi:hypothetical protein
MLLSSMHTLQLSPRPELSTQHLALPSMPPSPSLLPSLLLFGESQALLMASSQADTGSEVQNSLAPQWQLESGAPLMSLCQM